MRTHLSERLVNWASVLEPKTEAQARATASMPFVYPHLALMPDAHLGKGATVGSVIPTLRAIIPAAVGVDIGCGMIAVRTPFTRTDLATRDLRVLRESIERAVPLSAGKYNTELTDTARDGSRTSRRGPRTTTTRLPTAGGCSWGRSGPATTSSS